MDSFTEIQRQGWIKLKDQFAKIGYRGIEGYCLLDTQISYPALTSAFKVKIYCPKGEIENGMIAVMDNEYYQLYVCPVTEDTSILEDALVETKVINWNQPVNVPSANTQVIVCVKRVAERLNLKLNYSKSKIYKHLLHKGSTSLQIQECPINTYVGPLKPEFIDLVDRTWTFHTLGHTRKIFETYMDNDLAYVLYSKSTNEPIAWIFLDEAGSFTHLYCLENYRRHGFSEYITKLATNSLLERGKNVLAYTLEENVGPQKLFDKLRFECIECVWWLSITRET